MKPQLDCRTSSPYTQPYTILTRRVIVRGKPVTNVHVGTLRQEESLNVNYYLKSDSNNHGDKF